MNEKERFKATHHDEKSERNSVFNLVKQLANDTNELFTKEVALAKAEVSQALSSAKKGAVSLASGGAVIYAGFLFLLLAGFLALGSIVDLWLSALIIGAAVFIIGLMMVQAGKKKLEPDNLKPRHTVNSLHKDRNAVRGV